jgi:hypothetical protein
LLATLIVVAPGTIVVWIDATIIFLIAVVVVVSGMGRRCNRLHLVSSSLAFSASSASAGLIIYRRWYRLLITMVIDVDWEHRHRSWRSLMVLLLDILLFSSCCWCRICGNACRSHLIPKRCSNWSHLILWAGKEFYSWKVCMYSARVVRKIERGKNCRILFVRSKCKRDVVSEKHMQTKPWVHKPRSQKRSETRHSLDASFITIYGTSTIHKTITVDSWIASELLFLKLISRRYHDWYQKFAFI